MRKKKLLLTVPLLACMMLFFAPSAVTAADSTDNTINLGNKDTWPDPDRATITIGQCIGECNHIITGTFDASTVTHDTIDSIVKVEGGPHNITFKNVNIVLNDSDDKSIHVRAFGLGDNATVNLSLEGTNVLRSAGSRAALYVPQTATLNISSQGSGASLTANGGFGAAGIGGDGYSGHCGTITIDAPGSTIRAASSACAAGIGGGLQGRSGKIIIRDGEVIATGGNGSDGNSAGPGIGSNLSPYNNEVVISGGTVTATGGITSENGSSTQNYGVACGSLSSEGKSVTITANSISGTTNLFNGVVWGYGGNPNNARVYNDAILTQNVGMNQSITVPTGATLSIPPGNSKLVNAGRIEGGGTLVNPDRLAPVEGSYLGIPMSNRKVSLQATDIVLNTSIPYTGADLKSTAITINKTRRIEKDVYEVDTKGWNETIRKDNVEDVTEIIDVAQYTVSYKKDNFDSFTLTPINVTPKALTPDMINIVGNYSYTGEKITPQIAVKYNNLTLTETNEDELGDYEIIDIKDNINAGKGTITIETTGRNYSGEASAAFDISPASIENADVQITPVSVEYNGKKQEPNLAVTLDTSDTNSGGTSSSKTLVPDTDYTVAYSSDNYAAVDFTRADDIKVTVTGTGNYTGEAPVQTYTIEKKPLKITKIIPESRKYNGSNEVNISGVEFESGGLVSGDKTSDVTLASKGFITGVDVGDYDTISFNEFELTGAKADNYFIAEPLTETPIALDENNHVKISQADAPEKPSLDGTYTVSSIYEDKFIYTLEVKNPEDGVMYEYRMADKAGDTTGDTEDDAASPVVTEWQDSPVFDNIDPESTHTFEARSKLDPNVVQSEIGEKTVKFELLKETRKPGDFQFTFSPNRDEQTFTGTISSNESLGNVEYFIGKTGVEPTDDDYSSDDNANVNKECESNTSYTAYVRFKKTKTHQASAPTTKEAKTSKLVAKAPVITPEDGSDFTGTQEVTITDRTVGGATIHYTLDDTPPTLESPIYEEPFTIEETTTIRAYAVKDNMDDSEEVKATITRKLLDVETPIIEPADGTEFTGSKLVEISCNTEDATIHYTTDGTDPTTESKKYTEPFRITTTTIVKAIAVKKDMNDSAIATATLNKAESTINVHAFLNPFATTGEEVETNPISDELMSKLETNDKAEATESIYNSLTQELSVIGNHGDFTYLNMSFYDLVVKVKINSDPLRDATLDDFAEGGYTITVPYPEGTSLEANDFAIAHMVASGDNTGNVETWYANTVTKTPYGLQFNITSASPLAIAWTAAVPGGPNSNPTSDGNNVVDPDDPDNNNPDDNDPDDNNPDDNNPGGDTNTDNPNQNSNGIVTANPRDADGAAASGDAAGTGSVTDAIRSAVSSLLPKTGDTNKIIAWVVVAVVAAGVIIGIRVKAKKSNKPKNGH